MNQDPYSLGLTEDASGGFMSVMTQLLETTAQSFGSAANARLNQWANSAIGSGSTGTSQPVPAAAPASTNYVPMLIGAGVLAFLLIRNRK